MKRYLAIVIAFAVLMLAAASLFADDAVKKAGADKSGAAAPASAAADKAAMPASEHVMMMPADMKWTDAPASLPKGAKMAVLHGNPSAPGIFAMRIMVPDGYKVPPHFHPAEEHVTVISGEFNMALGDKWDTAKGHAMPAGSFSIMPAGMRHFAWAKGETVVQIHAMGPWGITYVNPQDDPRNQKQATK